MELRSSEKELSNLSSIYQNLYNSKLISNNHQEIKSWSTLFQYRRNDSSVQSPSSIYYMHDYLSSWQDLLSSNEKKEEEQKIVKESNEQDMLILNIDQTLELFYSIQKRVEILQPKMQVFQKRMKERDPITNAPRYGEKTMKRVKTVLHINQALLSFLDSTLIQTLETISNDEKLYKKEQTNKEKQNQVKMDQQRKQEEMNQQMYQKQKEEIEKQKKIDEKIEIARRAKEHREAKEMEKKRMEQAKIDRRNADKEYMASIEKDEVGVQIQLEKLKQSLLETNYQPKEYSTVIKSLSMIFKQIISHPDNENYRKIRKDHERFHNDIGRHSGGCELLIAAGFHLTRLDQEDDAIVFFMKEPSIEADMDGWSAWYDGLKSTLKLIEAEIL